MKIDVKDPQALHDGLIEAHRRFYEGAPQEQLSPMIFLYPENAPSMAVVLPMSDDTDRDSMAEALRQAIKQFDIAMYAFMAETWVAAQDGPITAETPKPSKREDRREAVVTVVVCKDGRKVGSLMEINRDWTTGDAVLGEVDAMSGDGFGGRFAELFDE